MSFQRHDNVPDSPTNNFATLNPLDVSAIANGREISEGNLKAIQANSRTDITIPVSTDSTYFEVICPRRYSNIFSGAFVFKKSTKAGNADIVAVVAFQDTLKFYSDDHVTLVKTESFTFDTTKIVAIHLLKTSGQTTITVYNNGAIIGSYTYNEDIQMVTDSGNGTNTSDGSIHVLNFGQDPTFGGATGLPTAPSGSPFTDANGIGSFYYDPPTGALALCTANLPDPAIDPNVNDLPEDYMRAVDYIGNTSNDREISVNFPVDLVWIKNRDASAGHILADTVRGAGKLLHSDSTTDESNFTAAWKSSYGDVTGFTQNGFKVNTGANTNGNGQKMIAWCWKAGGAPSATDDGNGISDSAKLIDTSGTASSTTCKSFQDAAVTAGASNVICPSKMSINQKAGFSIVKYTGTGSTGGTVPHGLAKKPDIVIIKNLIDGTKSWNVTSFLTTPSTVLTDSIFNIGSKTGGVLGLNHTNSANSYSIDGQTSGNGQDHIAYCWHSVAGYSAFGSYTGNESTDGTFVECDFRVGWLMVKAVDYSATTTSWQIWDTARSEYNPANKVLYANKTAGEGYRGDGSTSYSTMDVDLISNGFKFRNYPNENNKGSTKYIYAAFAEIPFKYATAR